MNLIWLFFYIDCGKAIVDAFWSIKNNLMKKTTVKDEHEN